MRTKLALVTVLLAFALASGVLAQQTYGQDGQSNADQSRQTTSASWSSAGATQPEQAGDLYQARSRGNGAFGTGTPQDSILPGALNPGTQSLDNGRQPEVKE